MKRLNLKANSKAVRTYYQEIENLSQLKLFNEGAVSPTFAALLRFCARQFDWTLAEQHVYKRGKRSIRPDGVLLDSFSMVRGVWEAKDTADDLATEVKKKFAAGYPRDNIIFQSPERIIVWQDGAEALDTAIDKPGALVMALRLFFEYEPPALEAWEQAVEEFKEVVPDLAGKLLVRIDEELKRNRRFIRAFNEFTGLCQRALNPNISTNAIKEMLIQHLLTERIFRRVLRYSDFSSRNIIAREIEKVIAALTSQVFDRDEFLKDLNYLYDAIESTAATIDDYAEKQGFLNTVYEKFFQGFSVKVADTHGIVYTPQPIVEFMVRSVDEILKREFGRANGLGSKDVHILDPFVGTGNFILRVMRQMTPRQLMRKYGEELHCNEVMLLPYYIASMNIEHEYYELTNRYEPFSGICLVDTFELAEKEGPQMTLGLFTEENSERVQQQQQAPIFVVIGNPPYNAGQVNENDNNKNRAYPVLDQRVRDTYALDSRATLTNSLYDPYVKAFRWAADRIGDEGVIAFVTNNSFINQLSFDGMRKHLGQDFDAIYVLDLGGNVRQNPKLSGTTHNVFGIQVGVSIAFLIKRKAKNADEAHVYYAYMDEFWRKEQKYDFLETHLDYTRLDWQELTPNKKHTWLTEGLHSEFEGFLPMGTKEAKRAKRGEAETIFKVYSSGVKTNRDTWVYNFSSELLYNNMQNMINVYNSHVHKWKSLSHKPKVDDFVINDHQQIKWSGDLKVELKKEKLADFSDEKIRVSLYRPFTREYLFFDRMMNNSVYLFPRIFPTPETEDENRIICVAGIGNRKGFGCLITNLIPSLDLAFEKGQCFPFYTYNEDGTGREENLTDWALTQFREHYDDTTISKWQIFYYVYALLHHPSYRDKYAENLKRELPRIPYAPDFHSFASAGEKLATLHLDYIMPCGYEQAEPYDLEEIENPNVPFSLRIEKMKLSRDKTKLRVNDYLTLVGLPAEVFDYKLGNRSALEWVIDQYQVKTDKRSGITNDPNRDDNPEYILRLVGQVITVSLETVRIVQGLSTSINHD